MSNLTAHPDRPFFRAPCTARGSPPRASGCVHPPSRTRTARCCRWAQSKRPGPCLSTNQHRQRPKINTQPSIHRSPSAQSVQSFCFSYKVVKKNRPALRFRPHSQGALVTRVDASLAKQHPQLQVGRIVYRINTTGSRASPVSADVAKSILERSGDFTVHTATQ